ncbi:MAG: PSD1 and planctomycete cytochrome C domain-containing protein [Bacteroidota bacterium]
MQVFLKYCCAATILLLCACNQTPPAPTVADQLEALGELDYNFHVKPILSQNCYLCHGPDASSREADLRLDVQDAAYAMRDSLPAILPGDVESSLLVQRIKAQDPEMRMPPPEAHKTLSALEIAILEKWVQQGAQYKKHWAFISPERPATPATSKPAWVTNDIDAFILDRLDREGLTPSDIADKRTLIRRLSYDLTGLPPSPEDILAFVNNKAPNAYEQLVDQLLSSKHFGERMAVHWMDLARYADTNGYSIDGGRHMWLWRDWVINAFNNNLPYDQFVTEQLAGDLLLDPAESQLIATGFNRNHMNTHEGGTIAEENLTNYVVDRVKTTSEVFLGLTMACAQCHDHKFDPISQREYFQFFAYFNTVDDQGHDGDRGINSRPFINARTVLADTVEIQELKAAIAALEAKQEAPDDQQVTWEEAQRRQLAARGAGLAFTQVAPIKITTPNSGHTGQVLEDGSLLIDRPGWLAAYNVSAKVQQADAPITGLRVVFAPHEVSKGQVGHGQRENMEGALVVTNVAISQGTLPSDQVDLYNLVPYAQVTASSVHPNHPTAGVFDERRLEGWSPAPDQLRESQHLTITFDEALDPATVPYLTIMLNFGYGDNLIPGNFTIYTMAGADNGTNLPADIQASLLTAEANRTPEQAAALRKHYYEVAPATKNLRHAINNYKERLAVLTEAHPTMVMNVADTPRETFVLNRGQYDQKLEKVSPGTPAILPPVSNETAGSRLDLAKWLTRSDHPLTARVTVNRFWQMLFGTGLVATAADFGAQGSLPSHPELLDWLAVEFIDNGWDVKSLLKTMVMSSTYRQRAAASDALLAADPQNLLLARGPRFRLQAEFIRDGLLKASDLLVDRIGGPSVNPYQPAGLWKEVSHYGSTGATAQVFVQDHGEKLYRRSLYTYWKRTLPPPSMLTFDAPNREVCTITREVTNTPLQALVLLNDPQYVEASRHFASRILRELPEGSDTARLKRAFEILQSRHPDRQELKILRRRLDDERAHFAQAAADASAYLSVGESALDPTFEPAELAAWTTVASLIFNLSETITRG